MVNSERFPIELFGFAMAVVGYIWMIRNIRADPEPIQHIWRYRRIDRVMPLPPDRTVAASERARRGRAIARAMIWAVTVVFFVSVFWFVARPALLYGFQPLPIELVGIAMAVLGLLWMVRIYRANPEPDQHAWRYRAR